LDGRAFERAIRRWTDRQAERKDCQAVSLDGKTLRGTQGHELPGVHVLAAYAHEGVSPRERRLAEAERQRVTRCNKATAASSAAP
jgi:hypothetical protein